jgi:hypothetical protein
MNLLPGLHLSGGGRLGPGLACPYNCNLYLVTAGRQALVMDGGCWHLDKALHELELGRIRGASIGGPMKRVFS